ncbi:hypothetical protein [Escherichia coli]
MKTIFYYAYIGDDSTSAEDLMWRLNYIDNQMLFISCLARKNNINSLFTVATLPKQCDGMFMQIATKNIFCIYTKSISRENQFEYPGFAAIKDFADSAHPEHLIYYCHSKGSANRSERSLGIFKYHQVININNSVIARIKQHDIVKAGLYPSKSGFLWHNFFWVKASYLATKKIEVSSGRHYYESLIGGDFNDISKKTLGTLFIKPPSEDFKILDCYDAKDILGKKELDLMYNEHISIKP